MKTHCMASAGDVWSQSEADRIQWDHRRYGSGGFGLPMFQIRLFPSFPLAFHIHHEDRRETSLQACVQRQDLCAVHTALEEIWMFLCSLLRIPCACGFAGSELLCIRLPAWHKLLWRVNLGYYLGQGCYSFINSGLGHYFCTFILASLF